MSQHHAFRIVLAGTVAAALLNRIAAADDAEQPKADGSGRRTSVSAANVRGTSSNKHALRAQFRLSTFSADVTCPVGHPLLGGLYAAAEKVVDPLQARGFVLLGPDKPIVLCAIDWCEIRNQSYDLWRDELAKAAKTRRERVLVCSLHQHDAPLTDLHAQELLAQVGLAGEMFDPKFERDCIKRTAKALRESLRHTRRVTQLGIGKSKVERIASSRRVVLEDGRVTYDRGSNGGGRAFNRDAPIGLIDPWLRTLSFWDNETPIAAISFSP